MKIHHIEARSYVDGPGERTTLFVQGCPIHCSGCQNKSLWPAEGGVVVDENHLAITLSTLAVYHGNVTISGGEPFAQPASLARLLKALKGYGVRNIILYSGYTWETLTNPINGSWLWVQEALRYIDMLVDGRFDTTQDNDFINWRGSGNQRPIDVQASLQSNNLVILDWSEPEVTITADGGLVLPRGLAQELAEMGEERESRMCGEIAPI
jgi:anaerobic ribonucleoside-triphosphate reductase activating protein